LIESVVETFHGCFYMSTAVGTHRAQ